MRFGGLCGVIHELARSDPVRLLVLVHEKNKKLNHTNQPKGNC